MKRPTPAAIRGAALLAECRALVEGYPDVLIAACGDHRVRLPLATRLASVPQTPRVRAALTILAGDPHPGVRKMAAMALTQEPDR